MDAFTTLSARPNRPRSPDREGIPKTVGARAIQTITIYGASDDCIEIDGDISEEFYLAGDEENTLTFDDGTVVGIRYDDSGVWKVRAIKSDTATILSHHIETDPDSEGYSDRLTLQGSFTTVQHDQGDEEDEE